MASFMSVFKYLEIRLEDIKSATNDFHDSRVIGSGGFGNVYKGELPDHEGKSKTEVAFKRLDRKHGQGDPEFYKEIRMLSSFKHDNLISLLGYCNEGNEMILVYEYAPHGSLEHILNDAGLTWTQRLEICLGAAKGLSFLHDPKGTQQRVLHRDIKSANILLDENLNAKVADFGLSKISPANQPNTFLVTSPAGTHGYCDPLYMVSYQLTKESDVYSFGVVLLEVLCGRVCYESTDRRLKIFVPYWKKCYEQNTLDEIIFPDLMSHMNPSSLEIFVDIAYQCLSESREQRPTMSAVVQNLKMALDCQELLHFQASEYEHIIQVAHPPLIYKSNMELIQTLTKGVRVNGGKTMVSMNEKGEICERIYTEACLDQIQCDRLIDPSDLINSRFPGGRCYFKHEDELKVRVRAQFLCPLIAYSLNIVFRNVGKNMCKTLHYSLNGEPKCYMVRETCKREDEWFVVPLYQFTSDQKIAEFEIHLEGFNSCQLQVAGFEFQPLKEIVEVELHDQWLEEYREIVKAASQSLVYRSIKDLKVLLSKGFHINNYMTWFSLNEDGEHSEMLSIANCLISDEVGYNLSHTELYSRFPAFYETNKKGFKVHIITQFLTPLIDYTVNLVFCERESLEKHNYVPLRYKLQGDKETSIVHLANKTNDNHSLIAELYQFTSDGRVFDLEIVFLDHENDLQVEGILFQPLEKVEHEQVLKPSNDSLQWPILKRGCVSNLLKRFYIFNNQEAYALDNNGKKCLTLSASCLIRIEGLSFKSSSESRFGIVAVVNNWKFFFEREIKPEVLSPETTYAIYLIYKLHQDQSKFNSPLKITNYGGNYSYCEYSYIYLVSPPKTPFIGHQNSHNPSNRLKVYDIPRQRKDGWMEVRVGQLQTRTTGSVMLAVNFKNPSHGYLDGLLMVGVEIRPLVWH